VTIVPEQPGVAAFPHTWVWWCFLAVGLGALYVVLGQVAYWLLNPPGGSAFYPPAGLALGVLVLAPRKTWPLFLAAFATAEIGAHLWHHRPLAATIGYTVADMAEPVVGALLLTAAVRRHRAPRAALVSFALLPVAVAPALGALIGASSKVLFAPGVPGNASWWYYARNWWVSDALGVLVVGSLILAWARPIGFEDRVPPSAAALAVAGAAAIVATGVIWQYPLVYIALPGLVWAAFLGGARAVTMVGAAAALAADWVAITGREGRLLASSGPVQSLQLLQLFIGLTFLTGLLLAVEIAERRRNEHHALETQRQLATTEEAVINLAEAERRGITRDTHDIVGHGLNAMLLQVGAARRVLDNDPATARELLISSEAIGRRAIGDLDIALAVMGNEAARSEGHGLDQLPELVNMLRSAGMQVHLRLEGERRELSKLVDWSAYRISLEALTNVLKHAPGASTTVTVRFDDDAIRISVIDDGSRNQTGSLRDGLGTIGMRERAAALGGTLDVGPNPAGGFTAAATLPTTGGSEPTVAS